MIGQIKVMKKVTKVKKINIIFHKNDKKFTKYI